jgi:hypothetical protein
LLFVSRLFSVGGFWEMTEGNFAETQKLLLPQAAAAGMGWTRISK